MEIEPGEATTIIVRFGDRSCRFDSGLYPGHLGEAERIDRTFPGEEVALWS